jgi:hypothetical protein
VFRPRRTDFSRKEQKILGAPLLAFSARGGCMRREKNQAEDASVAPPAPREKRKEPGARPERTVRRAIAQCWRHSRPKKCRCL